MAISVGISVFIFFVGLILLFAVLSNFVVIFVVWRNKKMRNVTNVLICNLSISDIILAGIIIPQNLHDLSHAEEFHEGPILCKIAFAFPILCITSASYSLAVMAFERRNCIVDSLKTQVSPRHCKFIIPSIWTIAILVTTPTLVEFDVNGADVIEENVTKTVLGCNSQQFSQAFRIFNGIFLFIVTYLIPLGVIIFQYSRIIQFVTDQTSTSVGDSAPIFLAKSVVLKKRMKIIKMLILVAVVFAVSWFPYFVTLIIAKVENSEGSEDVSATLNLLKIFLAALSTSYNVVLYGLFNPMFRTEFRTLLICCGSNKIGTDTTMEVSTIPTR